MASNPYVNKVQLADGTTLIDISDSTAVAADVASGKYFYTASGQKAQGTATGGGGGSLTQDANGYLVVPTTGGGGGGSTGLEYESGTYIPSSDISTAFTISFTNTHTTPPFFFSIFYTDSSALVTERTAVGNMYFNLGQLFSPYTYGTDGTSVVYGNAFQMFSANTAPTSGSGSVQSVALYTPYNDQTASATSNSRYWATETGITAYAGGRAFKANKTYKWIAIWTPST